MHDASLLGATIVLKGKIEQENMCIEVSKERNGQRCLLSTKGGKNKL